MRRSTLLVLSALLLASGSAGAQSFEVTRFATGLALPVFLTSPRGDAERVFIVEQHTGTIRIAMRGTGQVLAAPFLIVGGLSQGLEQGLLGLAFHPDYASNGFFYVYYTDTSPSTNVVRYRVSLNDPNTADPLSATPVLSFPQPQDNHNGGWIAFGPDDRLYIATGDGGGAHDDDAGHTPGVGNGQDRTTLLGKLLRIDVDGDDFPADLARNYAIPATNPFTGAGDPGLDEIWSYGLRNPWRPSFDRETGDLYIADVGQATCEELNVQPAASAGGENYGWRLREGTVATDGGVGGAHPPGAIDPIFDYPHPGQSCTTPGHGPAFTGSAVTGGYVYRGFVPELQGRYFFADFGTGNLWSLVWDGSDPSLHDGTNFSGLTDHSTDPDYAPDQGSIDAVSSFGEDAWGDVYILDYLDGEIFVLPEPGRAAALACGVALLAALRWHACRRPGRRGRRGPRPDCSSST